MAKWKIVNVVATASLNQKVNLIEPRKTEPEKCRMIYEPEQFPSGILKVDKPYKATALLFSSGKAVITGLKASNKIDPTIQEIISMMKEVA